MAMRKKGAKVWTMAKGAKSPLKPILLWGTLRPRKVEPSIRITEIVWDNGGWNIPSPPSVVDVPIRDVVEAGENLDALTDDEFKARINNHLAERFGADVCGWRYKQMLVSNSD